MLFAQENTIHLWMVDEADIREPELLALYWSWLNPIEQHRYNQFYFEADRHRYLVSKALQRYVLSLYFQNRTPDQHEFSISDHGKPYIKGENLKFNLTHTQNKIALVVSLYHDLGVDVETKGYQQKQINLFDIAKQEFSESELEGLERIASPLQEEHFLKLWTLKEASLKAFGTGLILPMNSVVIETDQNMKLCILLSQILNKSKYQWKFYVYSFLKHVLSVAIMHQEHHQIEHINSFYVIPGVHFRSIPIAPEEEFRF